MWSVRYLKGWNISTQLFDLGCTGFSALYFDLNFILHLLCKTLYLLLPAYFNDTFNEAINEGCIHTQYYVL